MNRDNNSDDRQAVLAEFTALRAEILQRSSILWNVFALQLAATGAVFSFALSSHSHIGFLLILPVITYALSGRYASQLLGTELIGTYIREVLDVRANKELQWEKWQRSQQLNERSLTRLPLLLVFPGVAVTALVWVAPYVWANHDMSSGQRALITIIWFVDIGLTAWSFKLVVGIVSRRRRPNLTAKTNNDSKPPVHCTNKPLSARIQTLEQCLAWRERLLGYDNLSTLRTREELASAYLEAGRAADAILVFERIHDNWKRVFGSYHPETLRVWDKLVDAQANAYLTAGRVADAILVFERNAASWEQAFGSDHPYTLRAREKLADTCLAAGGTG